MDGDLELLEAYLRDRYREKHLVTSWLPERLHDLVYRVSAFEADEGKERSSDHIYLWKELGEVVACILPDGENVHLSVKNSLEKLIPSMISFGEKNCLPLFPKAEDGSVKFWIAASNSYAPIQETLTNLGYCKYPEEEYVNCALPMNTDCSVELPEGFRLLYGEDYPNEVNKWSALRLGFHPEYESPDYSANMNPYTARKNSSLYQDSFECIIVDEANGQRNDVCSYCFAYVDNALGTALIEPVSTRERYRHRGFGTAMMHGAIRRCKDLGIKKCYVDSFGSRKDFYTAAGFSVEGSIGFWYRTLN